MAGWLGGWVGGWLVDRLLYKTAVYGRTFWGSNPSGCPAHLTSPAQSHLGPAVQIKPPQGSGCEDTQQAGLSRYSARHDGVWTEPIRVLPPPSGPPSAAASTVQGVGEARSRASDKIEKENYTRLF